MPAPTKARLAFHSSSPDDSDTVEDTYSGHHATDNGSRSTFKPSGACVHCKSLKVRCEFNAGSKVCQRCQAGSYECLPRSRKKRKAAPTHEDLQEKAHSQDCQIQNLLLQFDQLKSENTIRSWMSRAHTESLLRGRSMHESESNNFAYKLDRHRGVNGQSSPEMAAISCFSDRQGPSGLTPPAIVKHCALYPDDIVNLFALYFDFINPFFSLLDQELHTPANLIWTSPFLFTVICAVASRHYHARPGLYELATNFARDAAGKALIDSPKSVDVCQAYLILSVYPSPKKKWAEDRSWLLMGVAIRMATELELNRPPPSTCDEREALNRTRTWLNCYCVDGSHAIQFGKMPMLRLDDYLARTSQGWYKSSEMNTPFDVHLCAYVQLIILMAKWRSTIGHGNLRQSYREGFDVVAAATRTAEGLSNELDMWVDRYQVEYTYKPLQICAYRGNTTQMITAYLRLVVLAVGFQYAAKTGLRRESDVLKLSIDAARTVIHITVERLYPTGHLRYAMEANFLYVSFAAAYLINLLRPRFLPLLDEDTQEDIIITVEELINVLGSKDVALDGRRTPAQYARFLTTLLSKYDVKPRQRKSGSPSGSDETTFFPQYNADRGQTPPDVYSWPDILHRDTSPQGYPVTAEPGLIYQQSSDADMDFSLTHFVRTVTGTQDLPTQHFDIGHAGVDNWPHSVNAWDSQMMAWPPSSYPDVARH